MKHRQLLLGFLIIFGPQAALSKGVKAGGYVSQGGPGPPNLTPDPFSQFLGGMAGLIGNASSAIYGATLGQLLPPPAVRTTQLPSNYGRGYDPMLRSNTNYGRGYDPMLRSNTYSQGYRGSSYGPAK